MAAISGAELERRLAAAERTIAELQAQVTEAEQRAHAAEEWAVVADNLARSSETMAAVRMAELAAAEHVAKNYQSSLSWRVTVPLRFGSRVLRKATRSTLGALRGSDSSPAKATGKGVVAAEEAAKRTDSSTREKGAAGTPEATA